MERLPDSIKVNSLTVIQGEKRLTVKVRNLSTEELYILAADKSRQIIIDRPSSRTIVFDNNSTNL